MIANLQYITNKKKRNSKGTAINLSVDDVRNELGTSAPLLVNVAKLIVRIFRSTVDTFLALCVNIL